MHRYSLRFSTDERRAVFVEEGPVALVLSQFLRVARDEQIAIIVYCFMREHVHLLVQGEDEASDCRRFITLAKQYSGFEYSRRYGRRLWQRYAFERVLRESEPTAVVARYILSNPVRAGLAQSIGEYPFAGTPDCTSPELIASLCQEESG